MKKKIMACSGSFDQYSSLASNCQNTDARGRRKRHHNWVKEVFGDGRCDKLGYMPSASLRSARWNKVEAKRNATYKIVRVARCSFTLLPRMIQWRPSTPFSRRAAAERRKLSQILAPLFPPQKKQSEI